MKNSLPKICYVIPEYNEHTPTHFYHKYEFIESLKGSADIRLVAMNNGIRGFISILFYRLRGYKNVYVHYSFLGALSAILITKVLGGRVFYWNCGMPWLYKRSDREEKLFRFIMRNSILVTGTARIRDEYVRRYNLNPIATRVLSNSIDARRFSLISKEEAREKLGIVPDKKVVLFNHRLSVRKGARVLPLIIREFKKWKDILFIIVGSGPEEQWVRQEISDLEIPDKVRFEGWVPNERIPEYIAAADVFLMPSEEEGAPNALLEAMAGGLPFVASNVGGVLDITPRETHEFVLPADNVIAFCQQLERLLKDPNMRKHLGEVEREWIKRYDVPTVAAQFLELFQSS